MRNLTKILLVIQLWMYFYSDLWAENGQEQKAVEQFIKTQTGPGVHRLSYVEIRKYKPLEIIKAVEKALDDRSNCQAANALLFLIYDNYVNKQIDESIRSESLNLIVSYLGTLTKPSF
ncbi:MAG: hypothetical protein HZA50_14675 [Planctomycetes bacterium]|nr:hypothetical protein [Planctomycetota bacterium]